MKKVLLALAIALCSVATSRADLIFSTSATDSGAGTTLNLTQGDSASLYIWISTNAGQVLNGVSLSALSSNAEVLQATAHLHNNSDNRWNDAGFSSGTLGDLFVDSNAVDLFAPGGIATTGRTDFTLFSEIQFDATGVGSTTVQLDRGRFNIAARVGGPFTATFGSATVNVAAIPEPSSIAALALLVGGLAAARRRR